MPVPFLDLAFQSVDKGVESILRHTLSDERAELFGAFLPVVGPDDVLLYLREELAGCRVFVPLIVEYLQVAPRGVEHVVVPRLFVVEVEQILLHLVEEQLVRAGGEGGAGGGINFALTALSYPLALCRVGSLAFTAGRGQLPYEEDEQQRKQGASQKNHG